MSLSLDRISNVATKSRQQFVYCAALLVCCLLSPILFSEIGIVGEVYIGAHAEQVPYVLEQTAPLEWSDRSNGLIRAASTRPMLRIQFGDSWWPLMINTYTGGLADWPGRLFMKLGGKVQYARWFYSVWGGLSCIILFVMLQQHLRIRYAFWTALCVALAWDLALYRTTLAGTEQMLQLVWALCLLFWLRKEDGRIWGILVCIGVFTKITFLFSLIPLWLVMAYQNRQSALRWLSLGMLIGAIPLVALSLPNGIPSHDLLSMQFDRLFHAFQGKNTASREHWQNLYLWLISPQQFWAEHYHLAPVTLPILRNVGLLLLGISTVVCWRQDSPAISTVRQIASITIVQAFLLTWLAKDIHHLAPINISMAIWLGFLIAHLSTQTARWAKIMKFSVLCIWPIGALQVLVQTPSLWSTLNSHGLSERTQTKICQLLDETQPSMVMTLDYDIYGVIESRCPNHKVRHSWGRIAQVRQKAVRPSVEAINPTHLLIFLDSPNWIYNLSPKQHELEQMLPRHQVTSVAIEDQVHLYSLKER
ncbi:MAG: hypothetical protein ACON4U_18690 [Myxococcota bacterium]